jgi:hypothetical protein
MIGVTFEYNSTIVEVRIDKENCLFRTSEFGGALVPIENIRLDKAGSIKEHPDLKNDKEWRQKTIKRFKQKLKELNSETERIKYIIDDLSKYGYKPLFMQRAGHRVIKIKQ